MPIADSCLSQNLLLGNTPSTYQVNNIDICADEEAAFGGTVVAAAVWSIWGGDIFPAEQDPKGNPEDWTREEMRRWLAVVSVPLLYINSC